MASIEAVLPDGVKRIVYDAAARTTLVYYATGGVDYFYGVQWGDFSAVASSTAPLAAVQTNLVAKYKVSSGHR
jgi:hypothetical protein